MISTGSITCSIYDGNGRVLYAHETNKQAERWFPGRGTVMADRETSALQAETIRAAMDANVSLRNADLREWALYSTDLSKADLRGANLCGADVQFANFTRVNLHKATFDAATRIRSTTGIIDGGTRDDGWRFVGWAWRGRLIINAGCRCFTLAQARAHWRWRRGTVLGAETTAILNFIERMAVVRGLIKRKG